MRSVYKIYLKSTKFYNIICFIPILSKKNIFNLIENNNFYRQQNILSNSDHMEIYNMVVIINDEVNSSRYKGVIK